VACHWCDTLKTWADNHKPQECPSDRNPNGPEHDWWLPLSEVLAAIDRAVPEHLEGHWAVEQAVDAIRAEFEEDSRG
jgi:organic radical activating enzyme